MTRAQRKKLVGLVLRDTGSDNDVDNIFVTKDDVKLKECKDGPEFDEPKKKERKAWQDNDSGLEMKDKPESYSYIPESNNPVTRNILIRGINPNGVIRITGETIERESPMATPKDRDNSFPNMIPCRAPLEFLSFFAADNKSDTSPSTIFFPKSETPSTNSGSTPRTTTPATRLR